MIHFPASSTELVHPIWHKGPKANKHMGHQNDFTNDRIMRVTYKINSATAYTWQVNNTELEKL